MARALIVAVSSSESKITYVVRWGKSGKARTCLIDEVLVATQRVQIPNAMTMPSRCSLCGRGIHAIDLSRGLIVLARDTRGFA
jgi:hypothetical protein